MGTITEVRVRSRAKRVTVTKSATAMLNEAVTAAAAAPKTYDIFLSHSIRDAELVLGVKLLLEDHGRTVYVDWLEDPKLDRSKVTPATAETIRQRMRSCRSLIYLHSENSGDSKWMPWELGYFDGYKGAVAILPVTKEEKMSYAGVEYLGIYPFIDEGVLIFGATSTLRVRSGLDRKGWSNWVADPQSMKKTA